MKKEQAVQQKQENQSSLMSDLNQYRYLKNEYEIVKRSHMEVVGQMQKEKNEERGNLLRIREVMLKDLETKILKKINIIERFIASIDDSQIRRIVRLRMIDGCNWVQIAHKMKGNTEDSVKKAFYRYMKRIDEKQRRMLREIEEME